MNHYLVETITMVKKQYLLTAEDMIEALDRIEMKEIKFYDKTDLGETIASVRQLDPNDGDIVIPNVSPLKEAKIDASRCSQAQSNELT